MKSLKRTRSRRALRRGRGMAAGIVFTLAAANPCVAKESKYDFEEDDGPIAPDAPVSILEDDSDLAADWRDYALELRDRLTLARLRMDAAHDAYRMGRHKRKMRGQRRRDRLVEREAAREALLEAEEEWAALPDRARRAGVPPGWIRPAFD